MRSALVMFVVLLLPALALAQNNPPVADAGEDQTVFLGVVAQLDGGGSFDPDDDPIAVWMWGFDSIPAGSGATIDNRFSRIPSFQPDKVGEYILSLIVNDGFDWSIPDTVTVTVIENHPPVAVATAHPTTGNVPLTVEFDGTASSDPEGGVLHYQWSFGDGLPVEGPAVTHTYDSIGVYEATLTVIDDFGLIDHDSVIIITERPVDFDFDAFEQPGSGFIIHPHPLDLAGYRFTSVDYSSTPLLTTFQQSSSFYNGSAALGCGNSSDLVVTRVDGAKFNAASVSLDSWPGADTVEITGERPGGGNVQQVFTTDSIVGPEPVVLVGFTGLTSLRFDAAGSTRFAGIFGQIDDLVVELAQNQPLVPALSPLGTAVLVLLLVGSAAFVLRRVRGDPH
jgi:hypothetical protein